MNRNRPAMPPRPGAPPSAPDHGLARDLPRMLARRQVLAAAAAGGLALTAGRAQAAACVALPWETAGPYPADGSNTRQGQTVNALAQSGVLRRDLRGSFAGMEGAAEGVPLELTLTLADASGCGVLAGHAVYVWHCNATGHYSLYDAPGANWLRGVGLADAAGQVQFTTIFPGCYDGRWPHVHFEVFRSAEAAVAGAASVLTAQIALPEAACAAVYAADARYANGTRNLGRTSLTGDNVFGDNTGAERAQQMLALSGDPGAGYAGQVTVPVDFTADGSRVRGPGGGIFGWLFGG